MKTGFHHHDDGVRRRRESRFLIHKAIATKSSRLLQWQFTTGSRTSTNDDTIRILDHKPDQFGCYVQWLYTAQVPLMISTEYSSYEMRKASAKTMYDELMDRYLLGHYLLDPSFQNHIVDEVIELSEAAQFRPGADAIDRIWGRTPDDCPMKLLLLRFGFNRIERGDYAQHLSKLPSGFRDRLLREFMRASTSEKNSPDPTFELRCEYHYHDGSLPRCERWQ